jgi:signal transduction histidine kinase
MLTDVFIRLIAAISLIILLNANGITTSSVVVSICIFLFLEITVLIPKRKLADSLLFVPFLVCLIFLIINKPEDFLLNFAYLLISLVFTYISTLLYQKVLDYKQQLYKTRDDSVEIETLLKNKNKHLVLEQDQQIHLATLNERNRIAREIHDNVGHMLSRGILLLGAIKTMNSDENIKPQLEMLANTLDESMEKMRSSVHDLHDDSIDLNKNFGDIIKELSNFKVSTELDFENNLPKEVKFSLIGILKEGVTNIIKHSNGDSVSIILHQNRSFCTLSISDNGKVDSDIKKKIQSGVFEGIGLENIKQRANSCNGDAYFYCNDGFTVFARLNF